MILYHLPTCDTCRKAIKALEGAGLRPVKGLQPLPGEQEIPKNSTESTVASLQPGLQPGEPLHLSDIRAEPVPREVLTRWLEAVGPDVLVNRRSTTWRNLSEAERAGDPLDLLAAHPTLMKRPVIVTGDRVLVGWTPAVRRELGL